jgi:hypothetical protein
MWLLNEPFLFERGEDVSHGCRRDAESRGGDEHRRRHRFARCDELAYERREDTSGPFVVILHAQK